MMKTYKNIVVKHRFGSHD